MGHPLGRLALLHPFPSALVAGLVAALAWVAGADASTALTLAFAMAGFQVSIGALNDVADLEDDARVKPSKPIPAGLITASTARRVVIIGGLVGCALSALVSPVALAVGLLGYACGVAYDLRLKRQGRGWLAFTVAFPLLVIFGWVGGGGGPPPGWTALLPIAALAGPALHLANALTDLDDDHATGTMGTAVRLGRRRSLAVLGALLLAVTCLAWLLIVSLGPTVVGAGVATIATGLLLIGYAGTVAGGRRTSACGWSLQAVGLAAFAVAWLTVIA